MKRHQAAEKTAIQQHGVAFGKPERDREGKWRTVIWVDGHKNYGQRRERYPKIAQVVAVGDYDLYCELGVLPIMELAL